MKMELQPQKIYLFCEGFTGGAITRAVDIAGGGCYISVGGNLSELKSTCENATINYVTLETIRTALDRFSSIAHSYKFCVVSTNAVIMNGAKSWLEGWHQRNGMNSKGKPISYWDTWEKLYTTLQAFDSVEWVIDDFRNPCDQCLYAQNIAMQAVEQKRIELSSDTSSAFVK